MIDFIEIFNVVARVAKPVHMSFRPAEVMEDAMADLNIDSLDGLVMLMYFDEIFGIADEVSKEWKPTTVQELHDLVMAHKTIEPESIEKIKEQIK
jgi:acyl carrier protein